MLKRSVVAVLALSAASTGICVAADAKPSYYAIVGAGRSNIDVDPNSVNTFALNNGLATSSTSTQTKDWGWKLQLGIPINTVYSLEAGYMNLGHSRFTNSNNLYVATGDKRADLFNIDFVGQWYFTQSVSLVARIGGYRWETKSNMPTAGGMTDRTDDGYDFKFGAGLQYDFNKQFGLRGSYDRFNGVGSETTTGDSKVNLLSLDAVLKF